MLDRHQKLALEAQAPCLKLGAEQDLIDRFQQAGTDLPMQVIPAIDSNPRQFFEAR